MLSPSTFEYSQQNLATVLNAIGIPPELVETVVINVELEYQKSVSPFLLTQRPLRGFSFFARPLLRLRPFYDFLHRPTAGIPLSLLSRSALLPLRGSPFLLRFPRFGFSALLARFVFALRSLQVLLPRALDRPPTQPRFPRGNRSARPHRRLLPDHHDRPPDRFPRFHD